MFLPHDVLHKPVPQTRSGDSILLHPRPRTHPEIQLALVPLLPTPKCVQLPGEIWDCILRWTMRPEQDPRTAWEGQRIRLVLVRVCKSFKDLVSPMLYANPHLPTLSAFLRFSKRLIESDRQWDNLRRISHSTPGRWVQTLNLSLIRHLNASEYLQFDRSFVAISTMLPFLQQLLLHPTVMLTRRAMSSIADTETALSLVHLTGIHVPASTQPRARASLEDPLTNLVRCCVNLRHIELLGTGLDVDSDVEEDPDTIAPGINLPFLQSMAILHVPYCPLLRTLANSELPSLRALTISLYTSAPHTDSTRFFDTHASKLTGLTLFTAQTWPPTSTHAPPDLLIKTPKLVYLSLPSSAHRLIAPATKKITNHTIEGTPPTSPSRPTSGGIPASSSPSAIRASSSPSSPMRARSASHDRISSSPHPLLTLSIPRPTPELLSRVVEPIFKELREVHVREVRYLRRGMGKGAEGAGSSPSMTEWRRRLARRGVRVIDALGKDGPD